MKCISVQGKNGVQLYTEFMAFIYQKKANISLELYILIENVEHSEKCFSVRKIYKWYSCFLSEHFLIPFFP